MILELIERRLLTYYKRFKMYPRFLIIDPKMYKELMQEMFNNFYRASTIYGNTMIYGMYIIPDPKINGIKLKK